MTQSKELKITVTKIRGKCPVYDKDDHFYIVDGYILDTHKSKKICMHSLSSIMPYYVALSHGINPVELGLAERGLAAYVQCLDPCELTAGGTVTFKIELKKNQEKL